MKMTCRKMVLPLMRVARSLKKEISKVQTLEANSAVQVGNLPAVFMMILKFLITDFKLPNDTWDYI